MGLLTNDGFAVTRRPFRSVHYSASMQALVGGGTGTPRPGEITLAHLGILFLDELPEFSKNAIEALRQPSESGSITITRVDASLEFPARFTLVAAMNPCPCGYAGDTRCTCDEKQIDKYQRKLSGPFLDRIDLQVVLKPLSNDERLSEATADESGILRARVEKSRERQRIRFAKTAISCNAAIPGGATHEYCIFSQTGKQVFRETIDRGNVSTRTVDRLAKVSRTIADLEKSDIIEPHHVEEASRFVAGGILQK